MPTAAAAVYPPLPCHFKYLKKKFQFNKKIDGGSIRYLAIARGFTLNRPTFGQSFQRN